MMSTRSIDGLETLLASLGMLTPIPSFEGTNVLTDPLDILRCYLAQIVHTIVDGEAQSALDAIHVPTTVDPLVGDLAIRVPKLAHELGLQSEQLIQLFPNHPLFQPPIPDGKQLKIICHTKTLSSILVPYIQDRGASYGRVQIEAQNPPPVVVIEYSSPNIVSELNGKHFRSSLLGAHLAIAHKQQGWKVISTNYLGDWGKPIGLLGVGYDKFGSEDLLKADQLSHLRNVYRQVDEAFAPEVAATKKARDDGKARAETGDSAEIESRGIFAERNAYVARLESGHAPAIALWKTLHDASLASYQQTYSRFDINFDENSGESQVKRETMDQVEQTLRDMNICEESEGSLVIHLQNHGSKHGTAIIRDRTGSRTYLLRDLAAVIEREQRFSFDKMLYVVANDHTTHFHRLTKVLELLGMETLAHKIQHVAFNEHSQLPASIGSTSDIASVLDKLAERLHQAVMRDGPDSSSLLKSYTCDRLLSAACYAHSGSVKRTSELKFDADRVVSFETGTAMVFLNWLEKLKSFDLSSQRAQSDATHKSSTFECAEVNQAPNLGNESTSDGANQSSQRYMRSTDESGTPVQPSEDKSDPSVLDEAMDQSLEKAIASMTTEDESIEGVSRPATDPSDSSPSTAEPDDYLDDFGNAVLLRWLAQYPEVVSLAVKNYEPYNVFTYLNHVVAQLTDCVDDEEEASTLTEDHLRFLQTSRLVLANGLSLLGITRAERNRDSGIWV